MERCGGWSLESSRCGKLTPLEISLTWAYCLTRLLRGLLSSSFLDLLLIRLLVKNSYSTRASDLVYVYAHPENGQTNTSTHHNAFVTLSDIFWPAAVSTEKSCLMRHQGLSSCHIKWEWDTHYTITLLASFCHTHSLYSSQSVVPSHSAIIPAASFIDTFTLSVPIFLSLNVSPSKCLRLPPRFPIITSHL